MKQPDLPDHKVYSLLLGFMLLFKKEGHLFPKDGASFTNFLMEIWKPDWRCWISYFANWIGIFYVNRQHKKIMWTLHIIKNAKWIQFISTLTPSIALLHRPLLSGNTYMDCTLMQSMVGGSMMFMMDEFSPLTLETFLIQTYYMDLAGQGNRSFKEMY